MIKPNQIRAARNFLNIDQQELADSVGVSKMTISNIENEKGVSKASTLQTIELFFQTRGIRLTEAGGIEPAHNYVTVYEGDNCYMDFLNDAQEVLSIINGEILFSGSDERRSPPEIVEKFREMRKEGIKMRSLIEGGNTHIMGELDEYRFMPEGLFVDGDVKTVYADRVAYLVSWADTPKVIMIQDKTIAMEALRHFNYVWDQSETPTETTSPEKYDG